MRDTIDMAREAGIELDLIDEDEGQIWYITTEGIKAFEALVRADERALAAPVQEPVAWGCNRYIEDDNGFQIGTDEPELAWGKYAPDDNGWWPLYTTPPAQPAPVQEPVAWVCYGAPGKRDIDFEEADIDGLPIGTLLYTTPPAGEKK